MPMLRWNGIWPVEKRDLAAFEPLVRAVEAVTASRPRLNQSPGNGPDRTVGGVVASVLRVPRPAPLVPTAEPATRG